ncbi:MAG TPA: right-handed parallel beta-helix repeat-containing protein, partial [Pyrinomonadaceae bacterium]
MSAVATSGSDVYVGGTFATAGGIPASYIAKWDGTSWSPLGSGMNGFVHALAVSETGDLFAGGNFTTAGGVSANRIAKWDGSAWSAVGSGMNGAVWDLATSGTDVYAGGDFTTAGGASRNRIAKWDGTSWSALGSGTNDRVSAIALSGSDVYAGGLFTLAGGVAASKIAKWNGSGWSALGSGVSSGINSQVNSLAVSGSNVYVGGWFTTAGAIPANNIALWNGLSWSQLMEGVGGPVNALAISGSGTVYAGGDFGWAGGPANNIAQWNGSGWARLGSGVSSSRGNWVLALAASGADLYVGGFFTIAGGYPANNIAMWNGTSWDAQCPAATTVVLNTNDNGEGSLRHAIASACPGGWISFDPDVFADPQTITLTSGELVIDKSLTIEGPGANLLSIIGNDASSVFQINYYEDAVTTLNGLSIGHGIVGVNLTNGSQAVIVNSSVSGNGTGILNSSGQLMLVNTTVSGNRNDGIYGESGCYSRPALWVNNSTISGNGESGIEDIDGDVHINNSTITGNIEGGIFKPDDCWGGTMLALRNTIVAHNPNGDITAGNADNPAHNIIGNAASAGGIVNGANGNIVGVDPLLGPLQNNGGPTLTHALLSGSPAINSGDDCVLSANGCGNDHPALPTDQRGFPRNGTVDIGAFERQQADESSITTLFDFNGDGRADVGVYRPVGGEWWLLG